MRQMQGQLRKYGLQLHPEKTGVKSFGRYERENAQRQQRKANTFDFLGFTYYCAVSRKGSFKVARRTSAEKFRKSCQAMNKWLKAVRNVMPLKDWWRILTVKITGHYQYYGVSENIRGVKAYHQRTQEMVYKWLNRRSQRKSFNWVQYKEYLKHYPLPKPRIVHSFYTSSHIG